ncbi:hypothetical protein ATE69_09380 [Sphingopyxis sp. H071]|nr:hypothetical protein ATE61_06960 [Sphingopyxis sp. H057]KTE52873.1 hypothetical protein ATE64_09405 [Sphingopyxis sp. H073]KTE55062.1 hypothetical protein ATE69_09380 [Sphingopyxis sp. H071]KTE62523.1 hypothetical protein ATE66_03320 [Sphingopyxis sp. H107]KTE66068.1 hypothetical protein ATE65_07890 [Sphingopyxis sp. H100]KTE73620.1 hypothetical protein ATE60_05950 [Sphingopyxis sp. H081]KTE80956.1 hypothetical protein ATE63_10360 [Sphingopyxis sp. H067]MBD3731789.1 hypothetical protein [
MLHPGPVTPYVEQLNIGVGRRALAISLAVLISALLLLMLLTFGSVGKPDSQTERVSMVSLEASEIADEAPEPSAAKAERSEKQPEPKPQADETPPTKPSEPQPLPAVQPVPAPPSPAPVVQQPSPAIARPVLRPGTYGPPNTGGSSSSFRDSERVGTAPNGEPLYAATWYRQPSDDELRGYLSTASGPGWGLIACRTAPDYRVEDCVGLDEYPTGSQINRAVLAAAWQFKVRPPRLGGKLLVGSWVRIRIDYVMRRQ